MAVMALGEPSHSMSDVTKSLTLGETKIKKQTKFGALCAVVKHEVLMILPPAFNCWLGSNDLLHALLQPGSMVKRALGMQMRLGVTMKGLPICAQSEVHTLCDCIERSVLQYEVFDRSLFVGNIAHCTVALARTRS